MRGVRIHAFRITIRRIVVSSFGPWATAAFAVVPKKGERPIASGATLVEAHRRWFEAGSILAPDVRPSKAVASDLHLYVTPPPSAFARHRAGGKSHTDEIAGGVALAFLVLVVAAALGGGRRRAGGAPPRSDPTGGTALDTAKREYTHEPAKQTCTVCGGDGKAKCTACNGTGFLPDPATSEPGPCPVCSGTGKTPHLADCFACHGTGTV